MLDSNQNIETTCKSKLNLAELKDVSVKKLKKTRKTNNRKKTRKTKKQKTKTKNKITRKTKNHSKVLKFRREISLQTLIFCFQLIFFLLLTLKCITLAVTSFEVMSRISTALITISVSFYALGLKITYNAFGSFNWGLSK